MDLTVEEFVDGLFSEEAHDRPSDSVKVEDLEMKLPEWFDEKKFNQGRRFYKDFCFVLSASMMMGLIAVLSIPSILTVLIASRRSSSVYTAYKRYFSTLSHTLSWFEHELKPGSLSWRSLYTVRSRHIQAGRAVRLTGKGTISQRDVALTMFGFMGFSFLKPDYLSVRQLQEGDWEAYNHVWSVIGHMIGLEDRYNICRSTYEETLQVCQIIQDRVFTPCLENVPEYFEHMTRVLLEGLQSIISSTETASMIYATKALANVPGYIYKEEDRLKFQRKLKEHLKGKREDTGVDSSLLIEKCAVEGLPNSPPRLYYLHDYDTIETVPVYKDLSLKAKYKLAFNSIMISFYSTYIGRAILNFHYIFSLFIANYIPYTALWKFGLKNPFSNMFKEDPTDDVTPKPNSDYYKEKPNGSWYKELFSILW